MPAVKGELTITIPSFDELFEKAQRLAWRWAETDPWEKDKWFALLRNLLSGLRVGRMKVAISAKKWRDVPVPTHDAPELLDPVFLVGLVVAATSPVGSVSDDPWMRCSVIAQALAARLRREVPVTGSGAFRETVAARCAVAGGRLVRHRIDGMIV